jgi:hypothetical protein
MKFQELQDQVSEYVYSEDDGMTRIALASIIATKMKLGDPVWMLLIGPSSGGKSQVLRPLALTDTKFMHRIDDLTENTFLSGGKAKGGGEVSLLNRIGPMGMIVISDFTVIFSKSPEMRASILGQLRMVYDGEMTKFSGSSDKSIMWKGYLGMIAGSTPSIYSKFEEVADMGERFIYYRMKPYDVEKATRISLQRKVFGKELDTKLSDMYSKYLTESLENAEDVPALSIQMYERIVKISMFAAILRTPTHYNQYIRAVDKIPVSEMPMRVALQLQNIARGISVMNFNDHGHWDLLEKDIQDVEWCAYSLANEESRACLRILANVEYDTSIKGQTIADKIGLDTNITRMHLQHLAAIGILTRHGDESGLTWTIASEDNWRIIRRLEGIEESIIIEEREVSEEEQEEKNIATELNF